MMESDPKLTGKGRTLRRMDNGRQSSTLSLRQMFKAGPPSVTHQRKLELEIIQPKPRPLPPLPSTDESHIIQRYLDKETEPFLDEETEPPKPSSTALHALGRRYQDAIMEPNEERKDVRVRPAPPLVPILLQHNAAMKSKKDTNEAPPAFRRDFREQKAIMESGEKSKVARPLSPWMGPRDDIEQVISGRRQQKSAMDSGGKSTRPPISRCMQYQRVCIEPRDEFREAQPSCPQTSSHQHQGVDIEQQVPTSRVSGRQQHYPYHGDNMADSRVTIKGENMTEPRTCPVVSGLRKQYAAEPREKQAYSHRTQDRGNMKNSKGLVDRGDMEQLPSPHLSHAALNTTENENIIDRGETEQLKLRPSPRCAQNAFDMPKTADLKKPKEEIRQLLPPFSPGPGTAGYWANKVKNLLQETQEYVEEMKQRRAQGGFDMAESPKESKEEVTKEYVEEMKQRRAQGGFDMARSLRESKEETENLQPPPSPRPTQREFVMTTKEYPMEPPPSPRPKKRFINKVNNSEEEVDDRPKKSRSKQRPRPQKLNSHSRSKSAPSTLSSRDKRNLAAALQFNKKMLGQDIEMSDMIMNTSPRSPGRTESLSPTLINSQCYSYPTKNAYSALLDIHHESISTLIRLSDLLQSSRLPLPSLEHTRFMKSLSEWRILLHGLCYIAEPTTSYSMNPSSRHGDATYAFTRTAIQAAYKKHGEIRDTFTELAGGIGIDPDESMRNEQLFEKIVEAAEDNERVWEHIKTAWKSDKENEVSGKSWCYGTTDWKSDERPIARGWCGGAGAD